ncbi:MAG: hypothetical protein ACT4P7_02055 [Gemmatimonadaceae bacterium]
MRKTKALREKSRNIDREYLVAALNEDLRPYSSRTAVRRTTLELR